MTFERGALLLVPFPFTDLSAAKRRPVLALTAPDSYGDFVALPVTSRPQAEHGLPLAPTDLVKGSLPMASWIRTDRMLRSTQASWSNSSDRCPKTRLLPPYSASARISPDAVQGSG